MDGVRCALASAAMNRRAILVRSLRDAVCGRLACPGLLYHQINRSRWKHWHALPDFGALFLRLATKSFGAISFPRYAFRAVGHRFGWPAIYRRVGMLFICESLLLVPLIRRSWRRIAEAVEFLPAANVQFSARRYDG